MYISNIKYLIFNHRNQTTTYIIFLDFILDPRKKYINDFNIILNFTIGKYDIFPFIYKYVYNHKLFSSKSFQSDCLFDVNCNDDLHSFIACIILCVNAASDITKFPVEMFEIIFQYLFTHIYFTDYLSLLVLKNKQ